MAALPAVSSRADATRNYVGRCIGEVLQEMRGEGLVFIYSSQLVPPDLCVKTQPTAVGGLELAKEILRPYELDLRPVAAGVYTVIAAEHPVAVMASAESDQPASGTRIERVIVTASQYSLADDSPAADAFLTHGELESLPKLGDEALRAVHRLPGAASNGLSGWAHMRGGKENESQLVLNGLSLYEPFHLKNFLSPVSLLDARAMDSIDVNVGGFTVDHGDRMSALIDVHTLKPPSRRYSEIGFSLFHLSALTSDTFAGGAGNYLFSARRSNLDLAAHFLETDYGAPRYLDAFGRVEYQVSSETRLSFNLLASNDEITARNGSGGEHSHADYRNFYLWGTAERVWSARSGSDLTLSLTNISNDRQGTLDLMSAAEDRQAGTPLETGSVNDERQYTMLALRLDNHSRSEADARLQALYRWGVEIRQLHADYDYRSSLQRAASFPFPGDPARLSARDLDLAIDGQQFAAYVSMRWSVAPGWTAELGARWDAQTYIDMAPRDQWSPRLNLRYDIGPAMRVRASWGVFYQPQAVNELQIEDGIDKFRPAERVAQSVLSWEYDLREQASLRVEGYSKRYSRLMPRYENLFDSLVLLPELQADRVLVDARSARAVGVEVLLQRRAPGPWNWWFSYAWSQADDWIQGSWVPRSWDQKHAVQAGLSWSGVKWDLTVAGTYHTGWPTTLPMVTDALADPAAARVIPGVRNAERFNAFRSLDLRASRRFALDSGELIGFAELTNSLSFRNECCARYDVVATSQGPALQREVSYWLQIVPSLGVIWKF